MTLGERSLEREVLALFDRQADMLLPRIRRGDAGGGGGVRAHPEGLGASASAPSRLPAPRRRWSRPRGVEAQDAAVAAAIETLAAVLEEAKAEIAPPAAGN